MKKLLIISLIMLCQLAQSQDVETRLLPESFTQAIKFEWHQDGRVIEIDVENPNGKWVLRNLTFKVHDESTSTPKKYSNGAVDMLEFFTKSLDLTHTLYVEIQPSKHASLHIELKPGITATGLSLEEARGKEQTRFEKLKSNLF